MMEIINLIMFAGLAAVIILSALLSVFLRNIVHSVLAAAVCFLTIAGLFFTLNADFVGVSQILIYGVGVSILLAFAIMFTSKDKDQNLYLSDFTRVFLGFAAVLALFLVMVFFVSPDLRGKNILLTKQPTVSQIKSLREKGTSKIIGRAIFCDYVLPFELLSFLLLAGLIGAGYLANNDKKGEKESV